MKLIGHSHDYRTRTTYNELYRMRYGVRWTHECFCDFGEKILVREKPKSEQGHITYFAAKNIQKSLYDSRNGLTFFIVIFRHGKERRLEQIEHLE